MRDDHACAGALGIEIAAIASAVPEYRIDQEAVRDMVLANAPELRSHAGLFLNTGIKTRYSCVPFDWHLRHQGWRTRNAVFRDAATNLLERVARDCARRATIELDEIEAIVTVSTTGLSVPSLDATLANRLRLSSNVERLPVFGLGCAGGVSGVARAMRLAQSLPKGIVLLLVVELCTVNCRTMDRSIKNFISAALFGDGAAGLILRRGSGDSLRPQIAAVGEHMWPDTEDMMGWSIEDDGFGVVLSPDIPRCARERVRPALDSFLARHGLVLRPGGRKVLESVEAALGLPRQAFEHSWQVLANYGNMSSPTALFVLDRTIEAGASGRHLMAAFGPGFSISFALLDL